MTSSCKDNKVPSSNTSNYLGVIISNANDRSDENFESKCAKYFAQYTQCTLWLKTRYLTCSFWWNGTISRIREARKLVLGYWLKMKKIFPTNPLGIYSKSGQNGTWGQNGTPGVLEKPCQAWVFFQVHLISVIGQFSVMHGNQTCNRPRFKYLTKTKFHPFDISIYSRFDIKCFDKLSSRTAACG